MQVSEINQQDGNVEINQVSIHTTLFNLDAPEFVPIHLKNQAVNNNGPHRDEPSIFFRLEQPLVDELDHI